VYIKLVVLLRNYVTMMHGQQNIKNGWATIVVVGRLRVNMRHDTAQALSPVIQNRKQPLSKFKTGPRMSMSKNLEPPLSIQPVLTSRQLSIQPVLTYNTETEHIYHQCVSQGQLTFNFSLHATFICTYPAQNLIKSGREVYKMWEKFH
jgi:hypothetical protein